jgi:23S rRNA (uridine2552-2'-O)-methyltransferase
MGIRTKDKFTKRALAEGYLARSVYKLKDIQKRFKIIRKDNKVLDLGAAPGSWSQLAVEWGAEVDSIDLNKVKFGTWIEADVMSDKIFDILKDKNYDVVLSDLAPKTIGIRKIDNELSYDLCTRALEIANKKLNRGGFFVCKLFESEWFKPFVKDAKKIFKDVKVYKPEGSKKKSTEMYIIGIRKK